MRISSIDIVNFKNIARASLQFSPSINCVVGANGMGKSNLLEAVYYLSMTRSFLRLPDAEVVMHGAPSMLVKGEYVPEQGAPQQVSIGYDPSRRKVLVKGGKEHRRMSEHIGTIPLVISSPADTALITGSPEERRRLMDSSISQADASYMRHLMAYSKALTQRNAALKAGITDPLMLEGIETQLSVAGAYIIEARSRFTLTMAAPFLSFYEAVAHTAETPRMTYTPSREAARLPQALAESRQRDAIIGHTTVGPHRDDLSFTLSGFDLRRLGSQGQMKTFTIALRLALHHWLHDITGTTPLLLLDDIFDKLDASRVANILSLIADLRLGQTFITDTGRENIDALLEHTAGPHLLLCAKEGEYSILKSRQ